MRTIAFITLFLLPVHSIALFQGIQSAFRIASTSTPVKTQRVNPTPATLTLHDESFYNLGNVSYFSSSQTLTSITLDEALPILDHSTLTVLPLPNAPRITIKWLKSTLDTWLKQDDVISHHWLSTLILSSSPNERPITLDALALRVLRHEYGVTRLIVASNVRVQSTDLEVHYLSKGMKLVDLAGPYFSRSMGNVLDLLPVYRLYPDEFRTFLFGIYPLNDGSGRYGTLRRYDVHGSLLIPVPSRLYARAGVAGVRGQRIAVKDLFHIAGVSTGAGSRAYAKAYGDQEETAEAIRVLDEMGGILVGKAKTAQFASGSSTSDETIDEQYPFSPRADLHQTCGASSSGSACALAAYDWLDIAVGSDTGGSVRWPAALQGLYGNRPTMGAIPLTNVVPLSNLADTAGIFARTPQAFSSFTRAWLSRSPLPLQSSRSTFLPQLLIAPEFIQQNTPSSALLVQTFLRQLSASLSLPTTTIDLNDKLASAGYDKPALDTMDEKWRYLARWNSWTKIGRDLVRLNGGEWPGGMDPQTRLWWSWARGREDAGWDGSGVEGYEEELNKFGDWFNAEVLGMTEREDAGQEAGDMQCSGKILVYDIGTGGLPSYREKALNEDVNAVSVYSNTRNTTVSGSFFCPVSGCVDYTIPIGQSPFYSIISGREEMKPVTLSFVAHKGCDLVLMDFVDRMAKAGLIGEVKTGRNAY